MTDSVSVPTHAAEPPDVVEVPTPEFDSGDGRVPSRRMARTRDLLIRSLVPVILALVAGGILLLILGKDPISFYSDVWKGGIQQGSWEDSAMRAAPLLLIAVGLTL